MTLPESKLYSKIFNSEGNELHNDEKVLKLLSISEVSLPLNFIARAVNLHISHAQRICKKLIKYDKLKKSTVTSAVFYEIKHSKTDNA